MQYEKNNDVLFKVALVSLLTMIAIAAAIYYNDSKYYWKSTGLKDQKYLLQRFKI